MVICYKGGIFYEEIQINDSAGGSFRFCSRLRVQHRRGRFHCKCNTRNSDTNAVTHTGSDAYSEATPTPAPVVSPTALGVNIVKQDGTYYATTDVNLRQDCSTDNAAAPVLQGVAAGTQLTSTGVSEDGQWVEINYNGTVCYASAQYLTTTAPAGSCRRSGSYRYHGCRSVNVFSAEI